MNDVNPFELDGPRLAPAAGGKAKQLVVLLHGLGADGNDLISLAPILARVLPKAAFVSPHAPFPCDMAPVGRQWFSLQERSPESISSGVRTAAPHLDRFIDEELAREGLTDSQLALIGFSQGTMMALEIAPRRAAPCAMVIGYSGLLADPQRLGEQVVSRPPVVLIHGEADDLIPVQMLPAAEQSLKAVKIPVTAHSRPGLGHGIDETGLAIALEALQDAFGEAEPVKASE